MTNKFEFRVSFYDPSISLGKGHRLILSERGRASPGWAPQAGWASQAGWAQATSPTQPGPALAHQPAPSPLVLVICRSVVGATESST